MSDVLHLLQSIPGALKLLDGVQKAANGDPNAFEYLKSEGWKDGLNIIRPGLGMAGEEILGHVQNAAVAIEQTINGNVIEGEWREAGPPWASFVRRYLQQANSSNIILGPPGSGKTTLGVKLAKRLTDAHHYKAEACNLYGEDKPDFMSTISADTIVKRMKMLSKYLKSLEGTEDEDEDFPDSLEEEKADDKIPARMPPTQRVILVDEMGLTASSSAYDPARRAILQSLAQSRHLKSHLVFLAQWSGQLPLPLIGLSVVWVKQPAGDEVDTDRDNPLVKSIWEKATAAFERLKDWQWYQDPWKDPRSWAYCYCKTLNGQPGYMGLVPFTRLGEDIIEGEFTEVEQ